MSTSLGKAWFPCLFLCNYWMLHVFFLGVKNDCVALMPISRGTYNSDHEVEEGTNLAGSYWQEDSSYLTQYCITRLRLDCTVYHDQIGLQRVIQTVSS